MVWFVIGLLLFLMLFDLYCVVILVGLLIFSSELVDLGVYGLLLFV